MDVVVARCAGLDVHKDTVVACVRTPGPDGERRSEVRTFGTFTVELLALQDWLLAHEVTLVAMESTGVLVKGGRSSILRYIIVNESFRQGRQSSLYEEVIVVVV